MILARALARFAIVPVLFLAACKDSTPAAPAISALGSAALLPIGGGNALTLPAQRHLVRIGSTLLLALQQDGAGGHWLRMFRSDDGGRSWRAIGALADSSVDRHTADMIVVNQDVALVTSYEGPTLSGS